MAKQTRVLVTGAGGFIGHHLVKFLVKKGFIVRGVDIKKPEFEETAADEFLLLDLRNKDNTLKATKDIDHVYNLAANMGGIGYLEMVRAQVMSDNILINANMLESSKKNKVKMFFFSSSACIYPIYKQLDEVNIGLKEAEAYPAQPENEYGWEKLFAERLCMSYKADFGMETRIARFHNIYGPLGTWDGGREKSPAALCRKIAQARDGEEIEVWGDGNQSRSYCYIDDCVEGIYRLMMSSVDKPLNIGSDRLVTINQLIEIISKIAGKRIVKKYDTTKPQGVRGRNSDNTITKYMLDWEPSISLEKGLEQLYHWIELQIKERAGKSGGKKEYNGTHYQYQPFAVSESRIRTRVKKTNS